MSGSILMYAASFVLLGWGFAHLFPTRNVVEGFGDISDENKRIITMEWIVEGVSLIFIGVLVALVTIVAPSASVSKAVYLLSAIGLVVLALVSLFTGFKIKFLPFRLCPFIFTGSAVLIVIGGLL